MTRHPPPRRRPPPPAMVLALVLALTPAAVPAAAIEPPPAAPVAAIEPPVLAARVADGGLPAVAERLPLLPRRLDPAETGGVPGVHGGTLRLLMSQPKDTRMLVVYGYARLVGYTPGWALVADLLADYDVDEGRVFTFRLRPGHRWSDGQPFTAEDFRFWWEDVVGNKELTPGGPERFLLVDGIGPTLTFPDATSVRFAWPKPNPFFLPALAGARPEYVFMPAHYLKQFLPAYTDPETLKERVKAGGARNWVALFNQKSNAYRNDNPELPSLEPWVLKTKPPSTHFVFVRNPYFHRVDPAGRQLPYIDEVTMDIVSAGLIPAKTAAGDADLQARNLAFENYTVLKQGSLRNPLSVRLWQTAQGSALALYPNLNAVDPVWRDLVRDVRFRRALSLAINRHEINEVVYFGLAEEGNDTVLPASPLFRPALAQAWADHDPALANRLLDDLGLVADGGGIRRLADGRAADLVVETAGEDPTQVAILQLIRDSWREVGIRLLIKPEQRELMRNRVFAGQAVLSVWTGLENGLANAGMSPAELAPTSQQQLGWPKWGQYFETSGRAGVPVDLPEAAELLELNGRWAVTGDARSQRQIWERMLSLRAEAVFTVGTVRGVPQPVVTHRRLRNVPERGVYNWEPGAFFGVYRPDTFFFEPADAGPPSAEKRDAQLPGP